ncbi:hypothetical protein, partial [Mycolicibacterium mucogenicum]
RNGGRLKNTNPQVLTITLGTVAPARATTVVATPRRMSALADGHPRLASTDSVPGPVNPNAAMAMARTAGYSPPPALLLTVSLDGYHGVAIRH